MRIPALLIGLLLICSPATLRVHADEPIDCANAGTTVEMNFCADKDFRAADEKLNAVYKRVLARISEGDLEKPYDRVSWEEAMRASQRAWVAFRDADCKGAVPMEWSGGTGTTSAVLGCMAGKTDARIKELTDRYLEN
jgi:uncharacterized protein YecT (DUF1311 family)